MKSTERQRALKFAIKLAHEAGDLLAHHAQKLHRRPLRLIEKGAAGLASEADLKSEALVIKRIKAAYPDHSIVAEEDSFSRKLKVRGPESSEELIWLIDPLDGTNNFLSGLPFYCVSLALTKGVDVQVGVVHNPIIGETFYASKGGGAYLVRHLNGRKLTKKLNVSRADRPLKDCLISTNLGSKRHNAELIRKFPEVRAFRRLGSAALELSYVAGGILDAYWEYHLQPWDVAAGGLICLEAQAHVSDLKGQAFNPFSAAILAARSPIYEDLREILRADSAT